MTKKKKRNTGPSQTLNVKEYYQVIGRRCASAYISILKMKMKEENKETNMVNVPNSMWQACGSVTK